VGVEAIISRIVPRPGAYRRRSTLWSPWGLKEHLLRRLADAGAPAEHREALMQLVVAAVAGPYRCKDWLYARVAHEVDSPESSLCMCSTTRHSASPARRGHTGFSSDQLRAVELGRDLSYAAADTPPAERRRDRVTNLVGGG